ncbi:hypothetical protein [Thiomicrorhabdus indica]|uniref:hypothetical protein n=1 Tax=Thiomicrorhabdus indica TaxID=2267253 RepID=UPI0013EE7634|nr:hypothetical protein [Thiomicrorhabdus indica]
MYDYEKEFREAVERTLRLGLTTPEIEYEEGLLLDDDFHLDEVKEKISKEFARHSVDDLAAQCINLHLMLEGFMQDAGQNCFYTIGYVVTPDQEFFRFTEEDLQADLASGKRSEKFSINLHTWITLPTMEVIDVSLLTSFSKFYDNPDYAGRVIARHPSNLVNGVEFYPMIVGTEFLDRLGLPIHFM